MRRISRSLLMILLMLMVFIGWYLKPGLQGVEKADSPITEDLELLQDQRIVEVVESDSPLNRLEDGSDVQLDEDLAESTTLEGWIVDPSGQGIEDMRVEVTPKDQRVWQPLVYQASSDESGGFRIDGISPNKTYRIEVLAVGRFSGAVLDHVFIGYDFAPVTISLNPLDLVSLDGLVLDENRAPVSHLNLLVQNVGMAYPARSITSDASGFFRLDEFPAGDLQILTRGDDHFKISGLTILPGEYRNLTLSLDKGSYHLAGRLVDESGVPISQARVSLSTEFSFEGYQSFSFRFRITDSAGAFEFSNLSGQVHELVADAIGFEPYVVDHQFVDFSDELNIVMQRK
ncbi:MAG: carboxypeptidase-like regulatory domain-containing protein [Pseudomonadota bacterium]